MTAEDTQKAVLTEQLLNWLFSEVIGAVTLRVLLEVTVDGLVVIHGIRPHQVTEDAIERNLLPAVNIINLFNLLELRRDTSVHGEVLSSDCTRDGHSVEDFHEHIVDLHIEALQDFVAECKRLSHVA